MSESPQTVEHEGLLQRFFHFYSIYFGITAPPPAKQKLLLAVLVLFFVLLVGGLVIVAEIVSHL
ncbi:MAG TPA: hypothetical protein VFP40_04595 [Terriglobales bacterium]|jgi:hypothetical protein|nr:hypothetical protein [Terriglobales bacterium]